MEETVRALQQQVNVLMSQNAALEAQLITLAEMPGAITTVLSRSQTPLRRILVGPNGLGKPPMLVGREEDFYVWIKKIMNYVSGVLPNVHSTLEFACNWCARTRS